MSESGSPGARIESAQAWGARLAESLSDCNWDRHVEATFAAQMAEAVHADRKALILACCGLVCTDCAMGVVVKRFFPRDAAVSVWVHGDIQCRASGIRDGLDYLMEWK